MYKVFFKDNSFLLSDDKNLSSNENDIYTYHTLSDLKTQVFLLLNQSNIFHAKIYHPDMNQLLSDFIACFKMVGAAGGVVHETDRILMIKRQGMYDLPKGHIEAGESIETCAIREVMEECGVRNLHIEKSLQDTWHIYFRDMQWHLKRTYWYLMSCSPDQQLSPQTEEDIEAVFWLKTANIPDILPGTHATLRELLEQARQELKI